MGETLVYGLKVALAVSIGAAFFAACIIILNLIGSFTPTGYFTETMKLISIYMPFNPLTIFGTLAGIGSAVLAFLAARKVYQMMHTLQKGAN